jgi:hypothetical protein
MTAPWIDGTPLHLLPPGQWSVFDRRGALIGRLTHTANSNACGWRFFPADQGVPSRRYWRIARQAIPRRFGNPDALIATDNRAVIAKATEAA